jgi:hypothetical protein
VHAGRQTRELRARWAWTAYYRTSRMVKASQPNMLYAFLLGAAVSSLTIAAILVEDDERGVGRSGSDSVAQMASAACNAAVWTYCVGFTIMFAALYVKLQQNHAHARPRLCAGLACTTGPRSRRRSPSTWSARGE